MHTRLLLAEVTLDAVARETDVVVHTLEPRSVDTGGRCAARRAGT
jgi:hypothetical protein